MWQQRSGALDLPFAHAAVASAIVPLQHCVSQASTLRFSGMLQALEKKEEQLGITPEPAIAELMSGMHHDDDPSCNVALTLQACLYLFFND